MNIPKYFNRNEIALIMYKGLDRSDKTKKQRLNDRMNESGGARITEEDEKLYIEALEEIQAEITSILESMKNKEQ